MRNSRQPRPTRHRPAFIILYTCGSPVRAPRCRNVHKCNAPLPEGSDGHSGRYPSRTAVRGGARASGRMSGKRHRPDRPTHFSTCFSYASVLVFTLPAKIQNFNRITTYFQHFITTKADRARQIGIRTPQTDSSPAGCRIFVPVIRTATLFLCLTSKKQIV